MAISVTTLGGVNDTTNASVYVFTPSAPTANSLMLLWVGAHSIINNDPPTIAGMNSTWTSVASQPAIDGVNKRLDCFWAMGAAPNASTVTITYIGGRSNGQAILHQYTGVGQNGPVQSASSNVLNSLNVEVILASLSSVGNAVAVGALGKLASNMTAHSDLILLNSFNQNSPAMNLGSAWTSGNRSHLTMFITSTTSLGGIAVEISAATPAASARSPYYSNYYLPMVVR